MVLHSPFYSLVTLPLVMNDLLIDTIVLHV